MSPQGIRKGTTEGWEMGCGHTEIELHGEHVACTSCGQHEMLMEIHSEDLARLLQFISEIHETLSQAGMTDTAERLKQRAGQLVVNKRMTWSVGGTNG